MVLLTRVAHAGAAEAVVAEKPAAAATSATEASAAPARV